MMSEEYEFRGVLARSAKTVGATTAHVYLYTDDAQTMVAKAVAAGATLVVPVQKQYWGDRMGGVADPFGHVWWIATHEEDLSDAEVQERFRAAARATRPSVA
jgi:PhnB protein